MENKLTVSIAPHIKDRLTTKKIMWEVALSLLPAGIAGAFIFGPRTLLVMAASVFTALAAEAVIIALRKKEMSAVFDGSAFLTGLLLAYSLPPSAPVWLAVAGSVFAIAIGKQVFGGLGHNIFNPALAGRAFLMLSWPLYMITWQSPGWKADAVSGATPLALYKNGQFEQLSSIGNLDLFIGNRGGCIGEVCIAALIVGALYLLAKRYITWHVPACYIFVVGLFSWIFNGPEGLFTGDALFFVMSGGLVLGAFFMATDYVTSPLSAKGKVIFGVGCGLLTFIIRRFSGYPGGVCYAILIMNAAVPLIDRYTFPKWFGWRKQ